MPSPKEKRACKCEWLERAAEDSKTPIEFDPNLNEYHLVRGPKDFLMIYYCPFCGGTAPEIETRPPFPHTYRCGAPATRHTHKRPANG